MRVGPLPPVLKIEMHEVFIVRYLADELHQPTLLCAFLIHQSLSLPP